MVQEGISTSFYAQIGLEDWINKVVLANPDIFKSRSHFINCAIVRELRRLESLEAENKLWD